MEPIAQFIIVAAIAFILGLVVGKMLPRQASHDTEDTADYSDVSSPALQQELITYRSDVQKHLDTTAGLINELSTTYRHLHQHLQEANVRLGDASTPVAPLVPEVVQSAGDNSSEATYEPMQPMDYAPKSSADEGTLSENYGLRQKPSAETAKV